MVPGITRDVEEDYDDVSRMGERAGPKEYFDANKADDPDEERHQPMMATTLMQARH